MCEAARVNDEMKCGRCGLSWDVSDPEPPTCRKTIDRRAIPDRRVTNAVRVLPGIGFGCTIAPVTQSAQIPLALSETVALEMAALYEHKRGEGLGGIEAMQAAYRVFLDRLP